MMYDCNNCNGLENCNQNKIGYKNGLRCRYNQRGIYNTKIILKEKYKTFSCYNWEEIKKLINNNKSIYAWGSYGIGKTHMLYYIANKYNLQGHDIYINKVSDISVEMRERIQYYKSTGEQKTSLIEHLKNIKLLFLDDFGNEKMTDFVHEWLSVIIDHRYMHEKATFISSNYSINDLYGIMSQSIGEMKAGQLCSRLKTLGVIEIKNKNWRKQND